VSLLLRVLAVWGAMHLYVFVRLWAYSAVSWRYAALAAPVWLLLMLSPLAGLMLDRVGHPLAARVIGLPGMFWAGAFFLLFCVSLLHDLYNGLLTLLVPAAPALGRLRLLGARPLLIEVGLVVLLSLYSLIEARVILTEHVVLTTDKLSAGHERIRIVQITDVHLGFGVGRRRLAQIVRAVQAAGPDVIVSTGDLVDSSMHDGEPLAAMLAQLEAPLGKFAVTGNHEYYAGLPQALAFTRQAGFRMLMNETATVTDGLTIAGFEDPTALWRDGEGWDEGAVLAEAAPDDFVLVLKHRPPRRPTVLPLTDLQLSGHTHRGQIFPFSVFIHFYYAYAHGLTEPAPGRYLYTSRGTGTWGPPMRFLSPPEVTVVDLVPAEQPAVLR